MNTHFRAVYLAALAVTFGAASAAEHSESISPNESVKASAADPTERERSSEVVVTGTNIVGEDPIGSLVKVYDHEYIQESGAATLDQFARQMVENFPGVDTIANSQSTIGSSRFNNGAINNAFAGAAFNLHGLGAAGTLVLINGRRVAPAGLDGSLIADIMQIPLVAIDHVEVLTDGASAIYGADAVAGVVNIITRKDFTGAETSLRYGVSTDPGAADYSGSQSFGTAWKSGSAMINYDFGRNIGPDARERSWIPNLGGPNSLIPDNRRNSVIVSGNQRLDEVTDISIDAMYSDRVFSSQQTLNSLIARASAPTSGHARQTSVAGDVARTVGGDWQVRLGANYSKLQQASDSVSDTSSAFFSQHAENISNVDTSVLEGNLLANGTVVSLPGGPVKAAFGANWRREEFGSRFDENLDGIPSTFSVPQLQRRVSGLSAEFAIPLVGAGNRQVWARRLEISVAGRWDHYSDFGSTTNPKVGLIWEPVHGFDLRTSVGKSFHAPLLEQIGEAGTAIASPLPNPSSPLGFSDTIILNGGNPYLRAERAKSFSVGFDVTDALVHNLALSTTYFHVRFDDRISTPPVIGGNYFNDPAVSSFLTIDPPQALVQSYFNSPGFGGDGLHLGPQAVTAIFDQRSANIASSVQSGFDSWATYAFPLKYGVLDLLIDGTFLISNEFQAVSSAPSVELLNDFGQPTKWRASGGISWKYAGFTAMGKLHFINSYNNSLAVPAGSISSWTTGDIYLGYDTSPAAPALLRNLRVSLNVENLTDRKPPFVDLSALALLPGQNLPPFDPANASPVGRLISLQVTKRW